MPAQGRNEGFHVLDDFVCEAIPPSVPTPPTIHGRNEGVSVVEELVCEVNPADQDAALKAAIEPLASSITTSSNPRGTLIHAMELLFTGLKRIDPSAAAVLDPLRLRPAE